MASRVFSRRFSVVRTDNNRSGGVGGGRWSEVGSSRIPRSFATSLTVAARRKKARSRPLSTITLFVYQQRPTTGTKPFADDHFAVGSVCFSPRRGFRFCHSLSLSSFPFVCRTLSAHVRRKSPSPSSHNATRSEHARDAFGPRRKTSRVTRERRRRRQHDRERLRGETTFLSFFFFFLTLTVSARR